MNDGILIFKPLVFKPLEKIKAWLKENPEDYEWLQILHAKIRDCQNSFFVRPQRRYVPDYILNGKDSSTGTGAQYDNAGENLNAYWKLLGNQQGILQLGKVSKADREGSAEKVLMGNFRELIFPENLQ
ncbi:hypothetical protein FQA39_LY19408 [Lamprigera yunnana]|nr:hypothetical protein FQA39_LY19408 [Lamprigera yunnana]